MSTDPTEPRKILANEITAAEILANEISVATIPGIKIDTGNIRGIKIDAATIPATRTPSADLTREDYQAIRSILIGHRADGVDRPLLPADVDIDGDGTADCYGVDEHDELVYVAAVSLDETVYVSEGDDIGGLRHG